MHDDWKSFSQSLSQKFIKTPPILKNLKVYQKSQKLDQKTWNAW